MRPRHRTFLDATGEAVAHHQVITDAHALEDRWNLCKVVALVGVTHDDVASRRRSHAATYGGAVPGLIHGHHLGAVCEGDLLRSVGAAVVSDEDLRADVQLRDRLARSVDTSPDRPRLLQGRHAEHARRWARGR